MGTRRLDSISLSYHLARVRLPVQARIAGGSAADSAGSICRARDAAAGHFIGRDSYLANTIIDHGGRNAIWFVGLAGLVGWIINWRRSNAAPARACSFSFCALAAPASRLVIAVRRFAGA
ncbi:MAG: hypothetical protein KDI32_14905 [Pseudomonadales bacterium]|nr:hypothetical protein [Pseudomonadales bacterium]